MRYDPVSGAKVKVPDSDPRYLEWSNRKPSRRKKLQNKILSDPLGYASERAQHVAEEAAKHAAVETIRHTGKAVASGALEGGALAATLATGASVAAAAGSAAAILAAAYVVGDKIARNQQVKLGDRLNAISLRFTQTQAQLEKLYGVRSWAGVPAAQRNKALSDYKAAIATATSQAQGSAFAGTRAEGSYK